MRLPTLKQISVATLVGTCIDWIVRVFDLWSADYKGVWKTSVDLLAPVFAAMSIDAVVVLGSLAVFLFAQFGDRIWQRLGYPPSNGWSRPEGQSMAFLVGEEKGKLLDERLGKMAYEEVARLNEHVLQQQASLDTANNNINTSFKKLEANQ